MARQVKRLSARSVASLTRPGRHADGEGSHGFRNAKRRGQWSIMLKTCAAPLRDKPLDAIRTDSVLAVLAPNLADKEKDRRARRPCGCAGGSNACSTPPSADSADIVWRMGVWHCLR